ncbi:MAG: glycosyltransferase family 4 protein [Nitrospira sp.]|nr:glycosyltransferase family 4 protein [Nitrospira sp.]
MTQRTQSKIRVLFIDNSIAFGGALKSLSLLLRSSSFRQVVEPLVITAQDQNVIDAWLEGVPYIWYRRILDYRKKERFRSFVQRAIPLAWVSWFLRKCFALLEGFETAYLFGFILWVAWRHKAEIIHANSGFFVELRLAAFLLGVPRVVHCRGFFAHWDRSTRNNLHGAALVIGVSDAVSQSVEAQGFPRDKIVTIYDPAEVSSIRDAATMRSPMRKELGIEDDQVAVAIFGRVVEWKGQREFVQAILNVMDRSPKVLGLIVGDEADDSEKQYFASIKQIIAESEHRNRFILTGYRRDVEALYAAIDVFVHFSIEPEPFGMVVAEAMAAGKAVIAADDGGPKEMISHGKDGLFVQTGDVDGLREAIHKLVNDSSLREALGRAAGEKICSWLDVDMVAQRTAELYPSLLAVSARSLSDSQEKSSQSP